MCKKNDKNGVASVAESVRRLKTTICGVFFRVASVLQAVAAVANIKFLP